MSMENALGIVDTLLREQTDWKITGITSISGHDRPFSQHFTVRVDCSDDKPKTVFVKCVRGITTDRNRLEQLVARDHAICSFLSREFQGQPEASIPRPIARSVEHLMLISEFVEGDRLQDKILRTVRFFPENSTLDELASDCRRAGHWLRLFQQATQRFLASSPSMGGDDLLDLDTITRLIMARLNELQTAGVLDASEHNKLAHLVEHYATNILPAHLECAGVHGDFFSGNLLVRDNRIVAIDFVMFRSGSIFFDPTYFVFQLETLKNNPVIRSSSIERLKIAFLDGYAPEREEKDIWGWNPLCQILQIMHCTARLLKLKNQSPKRLRRRLGLGHSMRAARKQLLNLASASPRE
jgi:thiamine kinase-like enzyme